MLNMKYGRTRTGAPLYMTEGEIRSSFRNAKDRVSQIEVLADLNAMDRSTMYDHLVDIGCIRDGEFRRQLKARNISHGIAQRGERLPKI